jgi:glycosyltransferase involved in cell wall biosynthesis
MSPFDRAKGKPLDSGPGKPLGDVRGRTHHRVRVAIVAASLRILGGQAVQAQRMLDGWRDDPAIDAWLVPINPVPPAPFDRLLAIKFVRTVITQLFYWPLLVRELRRADVAHVFSASYASFLLAPLPAILIARLFRRPVILNYHSGEAPDHLRRSAVARFVLRRCVDRVIVPSPFLRDVFAGFGIDALVVSNSIDAERFTCRVRDRLRPFDFAQGRPRILSTRNLEPLYNVSCTLRAFARVQARYPDATLTVLGFGSEEAKLRELANALGLRRVSFVGRVDPSEIPRWYADADLYVQTPSIDNMPLSLLEAFAAGLPAVATRVGGVPGMMTDGVHGLLAPDDDAKAVAAQMIRLLDDPAYARTLAAAARTACAAYEWPVIRRRWLDAYGAVIARWACGASVNSIDREPIRDGLRRVARS